MIAPASPPRDGLDLRIDTDAAIREICNYISGIVTRDATHGVLMGMSGGLDSSVLATLAVRAVGPGSVYLVTLPDRVSSPDTVRRAKIMADWLGTELKVRDITAEMRARGVYAPLFLKALEISSVVARLSVSIYRAVCGENPFLSSLKDGGGKPLHPWWKRLMFRMTIARLDAGFRARHVFRRTHLENEASWRNLSLIGAANLSEFEVGWFVKYGIDDLPVQPLSGLFKTQVRQLAEALDLPEEIRGQVPSPDMAKGVTDEFGIGHDYAIVDRVMDGMDRGLGREGLVAEGLSPDEIDDILALRRHSAWKRTSYHEAPPVSGRHGSPLRRNEGEGSPGPAPDAEVAG
ncbi:NAD(+) synthase [Salipiger mucosus]|uniref:NH(3)-dependent NAD(+) synthetase n=1 Tax=Salipiger mucosus DSM 16094 TaxID=1123237 RepID=S9QS97_9RHOB|nr:NAD(+) synthase [Salipiger mucosus]EPX82502.1 hypothetical protein Salmuc_05251 [Salipiger mucosus DSM 16094]